jgi:hypothetical protein
MTTIESLLVLSLLLLLKHVLTELVVPIQEREIQIFVVAVAVAADDERDQCQMCDAAIERMPRLGSTVVVATPMV